MGHDSHQVEASSQRPLRPPHQLSLEGIPLPPPAHEEPPLKREKPLQEEPPQEHQAPPQEHQAPPQEHQAPPQEHQAPPQEHEEPTQEHVADLPGSMNPVAPVRRTKAQRRGARGSRSRGRPGRTAAPSLAASEPMTPTATATATTDAATSATKHEVEGLVSAAVKSSRDGALCTSDLKTASPSLNVASSAVPIAVGPRLLPRPKSGVVRGPTGSPTAEGRATTPPLPPSSASPASAATAPAVADHERQSCIDTSYTTTPATSAEQQRLAAPPAFDPAAVVVSGQVTEGSKVIESLLKEIIAAAPSSDVRPFQGGAYANCLGVLIQRTERVVKQHQKKSKSPDLHKALKCVLAIRNQTLHPDDKPAGKQTSKVDLPEFLNCFEICRRELSEILASLPRHQA